LARTNVSRLLEGSSMDEIHRGGTLLGNTCKSCECAMTFPIVIAAGSPWTPRGPRSTHWPTDRQRKSRISTMDLFVPNVDAP
jgi:hypothetical protein